MLAADHNGCPQESQQNAGRRGDEQIHRKSTAEGQNGAPGMGRNPHHNTVEQIKERKNNRRRRANRPEPQQDPKGDRNGFAAPDAVLTAPETRSSSPVRILRDESRQSAIRGLYPTGEGAGYAGGIMSAAIDGMLTAEAILNSE